MPDGNCISLASTTLIVKTPDLWIGPPEAVETEVPPITLLL